MDSLILYAVDRARRVTRFGMDLRLTAEAASAVLRRPPDVARPGHTAWGAVSIGEVEALVRLACSGEDAHLLPDELTFLEGVKAAHPPDRCFWSIVAAEVP